MNGMTETSIATAGMLTVEVQFAVEESEGEEPPSRAQLSSWAQHAYAAVSEHNSEATIRLVDRNEIQSLNQEFRGKDTPTNVLSFAFDLDPDIGLALLGDIVICHSVVVEQAGVEGKTLSDHYAHMVTHGILHLCGYDHQDEASAQRMEAIEIELLSAQGIANPYH